MVKDYNAYERPLLQVIMGGLKKVARTIEGTSTLSLDDTGRFIGRLVNEQDILSKLSSGMMAGRQYTGYGNVDSFIHTAFHVPGHRWESKNEMLENAVEQIRITGGQKGFDPQFGNDVATMKFVRLTDFIVDITKKAIKNDHISVKWIKESMETMLESKFSNEEIQLIIANNRSASPAGNGRLPFEQLPLENQKIFSEDEAKQARELIELALVKPVVRGVGH